LRYQESLHEVSLDRAGAGCGRIVGTVWFGGLRSLSQLRARSTHPDTNLKADRHAYPGSHPACDVHADCYTGGQSDAIGYANFGACGVPAFQFELGPNLRD
jgi:hypothetical protein